MGLCAIVNIKIEKREMLKDLENDLCVCISKTRPNIKEICKQH